MDIEISEKGNLLMYNKKYSPNFIKKVIEERKLKGLMIFDHLEPLKDINFLNDCSFLKELNISTLHEHKFDFLEKLKELSRLSINTWGENLVDLSHQLNLESLTIEWRNKVTGLENCHKLIRICLIDYKEVDLFPIKRLTNLKELVIKTSSIKTLDGVEGLKSLELILLGNCKSLKSIKLLNSLKKLRKIDVDTCPGITDYDSLIDVPSLEKINIWPSPSEEIKSKLKREWL